jgi:uncharacterized small protein (DUF1192 family)
MPKIEIEEALVKDALGTITLLKKRVATLEAQLERLAPGATKTTGNGAAEAVAKAQQQYTPLEPVDRQGPVAAARVAAVVPRLFTGMTKASERRVDRQRL